MKRKNWISFKDLTKTDKKFRIANLVIMLVLFASCVSMAFYYGFVYDPNNRIVPAICISILSLVPIFFEMIFGRRLNNCLFLIVEIYLIFAGLIGGVLNVYYLVGWYDIIIHILMGYLMAVLGIFVFGKLANYSKGNILLIAIFCVCFSLTIEVLWEIFEWLADNLLNQTMQGEKIEGFGQPLVFDTMLDFVCNTIGAILFFIQYMIGKLTKFSFGIKFIETNLISKQYLSNFEKSESSEKEKTNNINKKEDEKNISEN